MEQNTHVSIQNINMTYPDKTVALRNINLDVHKGEVMVLLGPSGCGKSTLLRIVAGLARQTSGQVRLLGEDITHLPAEKRGVGFVFQSYALFPTMTVRENIAFGLKIRKMPKADIQRKVDELLEMVNLTALENRRPGQLSGGEQQRVAIARVLAIEPRVLLMDEPLTALDAKLKERLKIELSQLFRTLSITTLYVTHDQDEAMSVADRIAVMNEGAIEQVGTATDIYTRPSTDFVAQFIGKINKLSGRVSGGQIDLHFVTLPVGANARTGDTQALMRPEAFTVVDQSDTSPGTFDALVTQNIYLGKQSVVLLEAGGQTLRLELDSAVPARAGTTIRLKADPEKLYIF